MDDASQLDAQVGKQAPWAKTGCHRIPQLRRRPDYAGAPTPPLTLFGRSQRWLVTLYPRAALRVVLGEDEHDRLATAAFAEEAEPASPSLDGRGAR
jgi:hypothetical protein